jgi:hypothetical protein
MAIKPARISLQLYDSKGGGGTALTHVAVDDSQLLSAANSAIVDFATAVTTVSDAGIKDGFFTLINDGVARAPVSDVEIVVGAVYDFSNAAILPRTYGFLISAYKAALIESNGTIDITATVQAAFVASMLADVLGGTHTDSDYLDLVEGLDAFRTNRKLRRRLRS